LVTPQASRSSSSPAAINATTSPSMLTEQVRAGMGRTAFSSADDVFGTRCAGGGGCGCGSDQGLTAQASLRQPCSRPTRLAWALCMRE
jgi:hypothetical protein